MINFLKRMKWRIDYTNCKKTRDEAEKKLIWLKTWTPNDFVQINLYEEIYFNSKKKCEEMFFN